MNGELHASPDLGLFVSKHLPARNADRQRVPEGEDTLFCWNTRQCLRWGGARTNGIADSRGRQSPVAVAAVR
jgi:hypothetical protein